jgi:hypothetical protein
MCGVSDHSSAPTPNKVGRPAKSDQLVDIVNVVHSTATVSMVRSGATLDFPLA